MSIPMSFRLSITPDPEREFFPHLSFNEPVAVERLDKALYARSIWNGRREVRALVFKLRSAYDASTGAVPATYRFADEGRCLYGRVYPEHGISLGEVSGPVRAYLLGDTWTALDFANCHPNIMEQELRAARRASPALAQYCASRDETLQDVVREYGVDRDAAKNLFIRLLYLGTFEAWAAEYHLRAVLRKPTRLVEAFAKEMLGNAAFVVQHNGGMKQDLKPNQRAVEKKRGPGRPLKKKQKPEETEASDNQVVSTFCQEHERRALRALFDFFVEAGVIDVRNLTCMLRYDGIDVLKNAWDAVKDKAGFLSRAEAHVRKQTGLDLRLAEKPYEPSPLADAIEQESDFESRIPKEKQGALDLGLLKELRLYPAQRHYFQKFVAKIAHDSNFMWMQFCSVKVINQGTRLTEIELRNTFKHVDTVVINDKGEEVGAKFIARWVVDPDMRTAMQADFIPFNPDAGDRGPESSQALNIFSGFANPKGVHLARPRDDYLRDFHYIGLQICEGDPLKYQFLWEYIAHIVQQPASRVHLSFVFQDKPQGVGSDTWFDAIGRLIGVPYYKNSDKMADFLGDHAEGIENKLLVVMNELVFADSHIHQSRLKNLITCERATVNPKHMRPYDVKVFARIIFVSNQKNAINFDNTNNERRFVVMKPTAAGTKILQNGDWTYLHEHVLHSKEFLAALYEDLMAVDLSDWDPKGRRELTMSDAYMFSSQENAPLHAKFFADYVRNLADKAKQPARGPLDQVYRRQPQVWEPDGMPDVSRLEIVAAADLHRQFHEFAGGRIGKTARTGTFTKASIEDTYGSVVTAYKDDVRKYKFDPHEMWKFLLEKKWVNQAYQYHVSIHQAEIEAALRDEVDLRFKALAAEGLNFKPSSRMI